MAGRKWTKEDVKEAMRGRAREFLVNVGGFAEAILDPRKEHPCPWCRGTTRFRLIDEEAGAVHCSNCFNRDNGDALAAIQRNQGWDFPTTLRECARYAGFEVAEPVAQRSQVQPSIPPEKAKPAKPEIPLAPPEVLDRAYRAILGELQLSMAHREQLLARGMSAESIGKAGYRSFVKGSGDEANAVLAATMAVGDAIDNVPGVYNGGLLAYSGLLIPVRNVAGQVIALRVRFDNPPADDPRKYGYVSSKKVGASSGTPCHVPLSIGGGPCSIVRVTEGELKAEVATQLSRTPTISCAGVNVWRHVIEPLKALKASTVLLAFDADWETNDKVAKQLLDAHEGLTAAGFEVRLETWDIRDGKGIDDLLHAGKRPTVLAGDAAAERLRGAKPAEAPKPAKPKREPKPKAEKFDSAAPPDDGAPPPDESESPGHGGDDDDVIEIDARYTPTSSTMRAITNSLLRSKQIYLRTAMPVFVDSDELKALMGPNELAAVLNTVAEVRIVSQRETKYEPLPAKFGAPWLCHPRELKRLPEISVFTKHPVFDSAGELVKPGYHNDNGIFYAGPEIEPTDSTEHLDRMLEGFCWRSPADRTNFLGVLLTPFFADRFIGSKPALLLNGNQPGLGKSILAQIVAILRDGKPVISASYNANDEEFEKTLGARVRQGLTTIVVDNAKSRGRAASIDSAVLERSITDPILCYRLLGQSATIQAENSHQFIITANSPEVSVDLMSRSVVVSLHFEGNPAKRKFPIPDIEHYCQVHRAEILGELAGLVRRWFKAGKPQAEVTTRFEKTGWGSVIGGILAANEEPDFWANQDEVAGEMDQTLAMFTQLVEYMADSEQGNWTAAELIEVCMSEGLFLHELDGKNKRGQATFFGILAGRFINEVFNVRGSEWLFRRDDGSRITRYVVRWMKGEKGESEHDSDPQRTMDF